MAYPLQGEKQLRTLELEAGDSPAESVLDLWDRQRNEPPAAYGLFIVYRDLGPTRTVREVAQVTKHNRKTMVAWAERYRWVVRARAWDEWLDTQFLTKVIASRKSSADQYYNIGMRMLDKASERLQGLDAEDMSVGQMIAAVDVAVKVIRVALGQETLAKDGSVVVNNTATTYNNTQNVITDSGMQETIERYSNVFRALEETQRTDAAVPDNGRSRTRLSLPPGS